MTRTMMSTTLLFAFAACGRTAPPAAERPVSSPTAVRIEVVRMETMPETFTAGGSVRAYRTAVIASRIMAPVVDVKVNAGDAVRIGQPLVVLDARELRESRAHAEAAALSSAQASASADAEVAAADASWRLAEASHRRIANLATKKSATPAELDAAVAALNEAEARRRAAAARRLQAENGVVSADAAARGTRVAETYATLAAPFAGTVTTRSVDPGNLATPGSPLLVVEDTRRFRLETSVDARRTAMLKVGDSVEVRIDGIDTQVVGTVAEMHEAVDPVAHALVVKIDLPVATRLRSGLFGRATFSAPPRSTLAVSESAVVRRGQLSFVYVEEAGRARLRMIHPGAVAAKRVPILAGLAEGDRVILAPPAALSDGAIVTAAAASKEGERR